MREKIKKIAPEPLWRTLKYWATVFGLRRPGMMLTQQDIALLRKWAQDRQSLLEIGVFEGGSAVVIREVMHPAATLTGIDPYIPDSLSPMRGSYHISRWVLSRCRRGQANLIRDYSFNVAKTWNTPLDFLFIDGDHTEAACEQDFHDWEKHVTPNGVILFHDSRLGQPVEQPWMGAEGSTNVVNKLFRATPKTPWRIVDEGGSIVVIRRV